MANKTNKKGKKPLQTTLGKASSQNEKEVDLSHVQKPIHTNIFGLRQVLSLFQTATEEVQNYITYECDIMYECRTCRTIFRSLANFILHKRSYCRERFSNIELLKNNNNIEEKCVNNPQNTDRENSRPSTPVQKETNSAKESKKSLSPIIEKLKEKQEIHTLTQEIINEDLTLKKSEELTESNRVDCRKDASNLLLEEIPTNKVAVFQTMVEKHSKKQTMKPEFMKSEVMEIHGILDNDEAVLGPDGKICTFGTDKVNRNPIFPKPDLFCSECNLKFSTKKTLTYHIKYKHNNTRLLFVCPDCKDTFANAWCVYRHLYKIHRRTSAQIKRMREQIHNNCIRRDQEPSKKKERKEADKLDKVDEENQWLSNIEGDNDFQMCGGCGKRFERKAALHSHAQMCTKRIAVCNTIKENNAKKKEVEIKENKHKMLKNEKPSAGSVGLPKGSSKRKPYLLRTYKPTEDEKQEVLPSEDAKNLSDVNENCEIAKSSCDNDGQSLLKEDQLIVDFNISGSSEEQLTPTKDIPGVSPSIEKIDTEKMLNIIGITSNSKCKDSDRENMEKCDTEDLEKQIQTKGSCHIASDFDLFCQSVAESIVTDVTTNEIANSSPKTRTVPLILRKKTSLVDETKSIEGNNNADQDSVVSTALGKEDKSKVSQTSTSEENKNISEIKSPSPAYKISVKSLEDLIGVTSTDNIDNSSNKDCFDSEITEINGHLEKINMVFREISCEEISETVHANISPVKLRERFSKPLKRKRTASFDCANMNKYFRQMKTETYYAKQDMSFISRAAPYMDQDKLVCLPCQISYPSLSKLLWHMSAHFSWFRFQCSRCSFISFNKLDCAIHAKRAHNVKKSSIHGVVLPIPNWKTLLMAHDFRALKDDNDLSGKHTDEVLSEEQEDLISNEEIEEKVINNDNSEWYVELFEDSQDLVIESEEYVELPLDYGNGIKQDSIDVVDDEKELFQIELPPEMYTYDIADVIKEIEYEQSLPIDSYIKIEKIEEYDDTEESYYIPKYTENNIQQSDPLDKILDETCPVEKVDEKLNCVKIENSEVEDIPSEISEHVVNIRPTRNRTRSIKTIQDDFFYDLSKVIKLNDSSLNKSHLQRNKKSGTTQKNGKGSTSPNSKSDSKLKVYTRKD